MHLNQYFQQIRANIESENGVRLAGLLSISDKHALMSTLIQENAEKIVQSQIHDVNWAIIVSGHLQVLYHFSSGDITEAFEKQFKMVQAFIKILSSLTNENWCLPVMHVMNVDMRHLAHYLDSEEGSNAAVGIAVNRKFQEKTADTIMALFRICTSDNRSAPNESKKLGIMALCNQLFKIYFQINKLNLCKPMIRAIDNMGVMKERFSLAQRVTYHYYVGRKAMFEDNYREANEFLTFAFENCHYESMKNKRLILIYLIPVKMLLGILPRSELLDMYQLAEFRGIASAVKFGNLKQLNDEMNRHENFFIRCGIYLILEKLKTITYRTLFKKVCFILNTHMLPIQAFTDALKLMGIEDVDPDETQCILANLIYEGKIKGYLAQQQQKLVVSKKVAFPPLQTTVTTVPR